MKNEIWKLFKITGDIRYYIMYKEMESLDDADRENQRYNS